MSRHVFDPTPPDLFCHVPLDVADSVVGLVSFPPPLAAPTSGRPAQVCFAGHPVELVHEFEVDAVIVRGVERSVEVLANARNLVDPAHRWLGSLREYRCGGAARGYASVFLHPCSELMHGVGIGNPIIADVRQRSPRVGRVNGRFAVAHEVTLAECHQQAPQDDKPENLAYPRTPRSEELFARYDRDCEDAEQKDDELYRVPFPMKESEQKRVDEAYAPHPTYELLGTFDPGFPFRVSCRSSYGEVFDWPGEHDDERGEQPRETHHECGDDPMLQPEASDDHHPGHDESDRQSEVEADDIVECPECPHRFLLAPLRRLNEYEDDPDERRKRDATEDVWEVLELLALELLPVCENRPFDRLECPIESFPEALLRVDGAPVEFGIRRLEVETPAIAARDYELDHREVRRYAR